MPPTRPVGLGAVPQKPAPVPPSRKVDGPKSVEPAPGTCKIRPATTVKTITIAPKLDILFVVDTSASLVEGPQRSREGGELAKLASEMKHFVRTLPNDTDYRIGVISGNGPEAPSFARLIKSTTGATVLDSKKQSEAAIYQGLRGIMTRVPSDRAPGARYLSDSQGEAMLLALYTAISDPAKREAIRKAGLLRSDASLAIIFVSDEQDICYSYPVDVSGLAQADEAKFRAGLVPVLKPNPENRGRLEPDRKELSAKRRFCQKEGKLLDHELVAGKLEALKAAKLTQKVIMNSITYLNNNGLKAVTKDEDENEMGHGILELVDAINNDVGHKADMAQVRRGGQVSFAKALAQLGASTTTEMSVHANWDCMGNVHPAAIDPASVEVSIIEAKPEELKNFSDSKELSDAGTVVARFSAACRGSGPCQHADGGLTVDKRVTKKGSYLRVTPTDPQAFERILKEKKVQSAKYKIDFKTLRDLDPQTGAMPESHPDFVPGPAMSAKAVAAAAAVKASAPKPTTGKAPARTARAVQRRR